MLPETAVAIGEARKASLIASINLMATLVTVGVLLFVTAPLSNADRELKELDASIRKVEKSIASQKNSLDLLRSNLGAAESVTKLIEDLAPKPFIEVPKSKWDINSIELIWTIENRGSYSFEEISEPEIAFSRKPFSAEDRSSDLDLKPFYLSNKMGELPPKGTQLHTGKIVRSAGISTFYWRIKINVQTLPRVMRAAKKLVPESFATEIEEVQNQYRLLYGELTISK